MRPNCFDLDEELANCARKYRVQMPTNPLRGYSFGYGSLNDTEYMCRTRWHILVFHCMRKRSEEACKHSEEEKFRQIFWAISFDTRKLEKAAAYICHEHNLRILREHQNNCLQQQEKLSEQCTVHRNDTIREVVAELQRQSSRLSPSSAEYYTTITQTLRHYECKSLRAKLECLYSILHTACPPNALRLVMNYFKETLPDDCEFNYEDRLQRFIESSAMFPSSSPLNNGGILSDGEQNRQTRDRLNDDSRALRPSKEGLQNALSTKLGMHLGTIVLLIIFLTARL
ncbi:unnamed protein product [Calicophoron daubneyi]|uniref:Uncharacterized protein n=1 Tax=Calicophoron daubneyi TaxID=300641 RepID=A0AAV2TAS4_CALDB